MHLNTHEAFARSGLPLADIRDLSVAFPRGTDVSFDERTDFENFLYWPTATNKHFSTTSKVLDFGDDE